MGKKSKPSTSIDATKMTIERLIKPLSALILRDSPSSLQSRQIQQLIRQIPIFTIFHFGTKAPDEQSRLGNWVNNGSGYLIFRCFSLFGLALQVVQSWLSSFALHWITEVRIRSIRASLVDVEGILGAIFTPMPSVRRGSLNVLHHTLIFPKW